MGHREQFELAVVDAEDVVAIEVQALHVAANLLIIGGIAETQVAVVLVQRDQVVEDALTVAGAQ